MAVDPPKVDAASSSSSAAAASKEKEKEKPSKPKKLLIPPLLENCPFKKGGKDVWRDSALRFMGYANEGTTFRHSRAACTCTCTPAGQQQLSLFYVHPHLT
jgi:hypothetical protein